MDELSNDFCYYHGLLSRGITYPILDDKPHCPICYREGKKIILVKYEGD